MRARVAGDMVASATAHRALKLAFDRGAPGTDSVVSCNMRDDDVPAPRTPALLKSLFRISVISAFPSEVDDLPDVFGRYDVSDEAVRFIPHFPFEPGVLYRATIESGGLRPESGDVQPIEFSLPVARSAARAVVTKVFPSSDRLPENLLRFHVCFSDSMQRGACEDQIVLLGPDGSPVRDVLYRPPVELWDRGMRFLTVLLDPGRLKRMVGPNTELGPPLETGKQYTLVIGEGMTDLSGRPLPSPFRKTFRADAAVRQSVDLGDWHVVAPPAHGFHALVLVFPNPLDWALLATSISVIAPDGSASEGHVTIDLDETRWSFAPTAAWQPGAYRVQVESELEDVCGNRPLAAFDRPMRSGGHLECEPTASSIVFHVS